MALSGRRGMMSMTASFGRSALLTGTVATSTHCGTASQLDRSTPLKCDTDVIQNYDKIAPSINPHFTHLTLRPDSFEQWLAIDSWVSTRINSTRGSEKLCVRFRGAEPSAALPRHRTRQSALQILDSINRHLLRGFASPDTPQDAAHLFRRDGKASRYTRNLATLAFPDFGDDELSKFYCDLLKGLVSNRPLRPGAKCRIDGAGSKNAGIQRLQIVPCTLGMDTFRKCDCLVMAKPR